MYVVLALPLGNHTLDDLIVEVDEEITRLTGLISKESIKNYKILFKIVLLMQIHPCQELLIH